MKNIITLFIITFLYSCSPMDCSKLSYIKNDEIVGLNGELYTGKCKLNYDNGKTRSRREFYKGLYHGQWIFYYENGNIETKGQYIKGKKDGDWKYYYKNGIIKQLSFYKMGDPVGAWRKFDEKGNLYWGKNWGKKR
tara:strand:+ start:965 stop:1372 length:408 start_codon:yes stop_codon:yes gene_type:complete